MSGRLDRNVRYMGVMQKLLGGTYKVAEDRHNGRTTIFEDYKELGALEIAA